MNRVMEVLTAALRAGRERLKSLGSAGFVAIAVVGVVVAIFLAEGFKVTTYDLQNPGVWMTRQNAGNSGPGAMVGHFNTQALEIESGIPTAMDGLDVAQDGDRVVVFDAAGMKVLNAATEELADAGQRTPGGSVELAGGRYLIVNGDGKAWTGSADAVGTWDAGRKPDLKASKGAPVAIGSDGTVAALNADESKVTVVDSGGERRQVSFQKIAGDAADLQLALVGTTPVVLDPTAALLYWPDAAPVEVASAGQVPQLQLRGDDPDHAYVAVVGGVTVAPAGGGKPTLVADDAATGTPVRPVRVGGCTYSAWISRGFMSSRCDNGAVATGPLTKFDAANRVKFRVNRSDVALNNLDTGAAATRSADEIKEVDGKWDVPDQGQPDKKPDDGKPVVKVLDLAQEQKPPIAKPDEAGARRNRSTIVPVLDNDSDPNGDVITIDPADLQFPDTLNVSVVNQGQAVQVTPSDRASANEQFTYAITDGKRKSERATVTVKVFDDDVNTAPRLKSERTANKVDQRPFSVSMGPPPGFYEVLPDWEDPEGDPMVLTGATPDDPATSQVQTVPAGLLTFTATGGAPGARALHVQVADVPPPGVQSQTGKGDLRVAVLGKDQNQGPRPQPDYAVGAVGANITLFPLRNDIDPNGDPLLITKLVPPDGGWGTASVTLSPDDGSVVVRSDTTGPLVFGYEVTDRVDTAQAMVRVDVVDPQQNRPPSAAPDLVLLPPDQQPRTADLMVNDWDPDGDVMMVSGVRWLSGPQVKLQLLEHRRVRVWSDVPMNGPATFEYTVSDGAAQSTGRLTVAQSPIAAANSRPVVGADTATVRTGDVISIPVLLNDVDPDGDVLKLAPELQRAPEPGQGTAFVSGSVLRFVAPDTPGTVRLTYGVTDDGLAWSSGQVLITVRAAQDNEPPLPKTIEARVLAGNSARVVIPLAGIDPDGDSVGLVGVVATDAAHAPKLGRVVTPVGTDSIMYEAFASDVGGRDQFTYQVRDSRGAAATGTVRVVVAPRTSSSPPQPADDLVTIAPGGTAMVPVLDNDFDPDGDAVSLANPALGAVPDGMQAEIDESGTRIKVTAPREVGPARALDYFVTDGTGSQPVSGSIKVTVSPNAPGQPPIARDDVARLTSDDKDAQAITVDVRANDEDPDGEGDKPNQNLKVEVISPATAKVAAGKVEVPVGSSPQVVVYKVTDPQGLSASAVVRVPAKGDLTDLPPKANPKPPTPIKIKSGSQAVIELADWVVDPEGQPVQLTQGNLVSATKGTIAGVTPTQITYQADTDPKAFGQASVMFEVTDSPDVNTGNKVTFVVPIAIEPADAATVPLKVLPGNPVRIGPGDDPVVIDLAGRVDRSAVDPGKVKFELQDTEAAGVKLSLDGTRVTLTASKDAKAGDAAVARFTATAAGAPVESTIDVQVVDSSRPPVSCTVQDVTDAEAGKDVSIDVLRNCTNPFSDKDLELVSATDDGGAGARTEGGSVKLTPKAKFVGTITVGYQVRDAVGRVTNGILRVTVRDVPGAPGAPTLVDVASRQVTLSWTAPDPHGTPITKYLVEAPNLSQPFDCGTSTTCTVTGLTNDVEYRFSVTAVNEVGKGDPGPAASARPDQRPDAPTGVSLEFSKDQLDGKLVAKWAAARTEGSAITAYEIEVVPAPKTGTSIIKVGAITEQVIQGLDNGTAYRIRVRAINKAATGASDWSADSNAETPAKVPDPTTQPLVRNIADPLGKRIEVRWTPGKDNGATITEYTVTTFKAGVATPDKTFAAPGNQVMPLVVDLGSTSDKFQVQVVATNKAGTSAVSEKSAQIQASAVPNVVGAITVTADNGDGKTGLDSKLALSFSAPPNGGLPINRYLVSYPGRTDRQFNVQASDTNPRLIVDGLKNETQYSFTIKACNGSTVDCNQPSAASPTGVPYGPVGQPRLSAVDRSSTQVNFRIDPPASTNGRPIDHMQVIGGEAIGAGGGNVLRGNGCGQTHSITVVTYDTAGQQSAQASVSGSTGDCPSVAISFGSVGTANFGNCNNMSQQCKWITGSLANFPPGVSVTAACYQVGESAPYLTIAPFTTTGGGGGGWGERWCLWGQAPGVGTYAVVSGGGVTAQSPTIYRNW